MEEEKHSAKSKGYNDVIYEVRWMPVMERPEYQEGPVHDALLELRDIMGEANFDKYVNNSLIRITYDGSRLMLITKSELHRTLLMGMYFEAICAAFHVDNYRVVSQVNGY